MNSVLIPFLTLGAFVAKGVELGGSRVKGSMQQSILFRAVAFESRSDADAFADLIKEEFPHEVCFVGTIDGIHCVQLKDSLKSN